ncbi:type II toxin-antitoxin system VapC family toxin [Streptomyces albus]|uniref:type II toxin-antitoxin system VapC family toxin n=1 Tax=Streptomyces albus TaxID=1888 RepID=UPI0004C8CB72|nr:type II toxin-antitoxin system VapC family toxin [Streptomyces albus]
MIVVDNSVLISSLIDAGPAGKACMARMSGERLVAPGVIDYEALSTLRNLLRARKVDVEVAERAVRVLPDLPIERVPCKHLIPRMWELRNNYTPYDAAYVALAEHLTVPLVTGDGRLARGSGARCIVELIT